MQTWAGSQDLLKAAADLNCICSEKQAQVAEALGKIDLEDSPDAECLSTAEPVLEPEPEAKSGSVTVPVDIGEQLRERVDYKAEQLALKMRIGFPVASRSSSRSIQDALHDDGTRISDAQARTTACIEHFRNVSGLVQTLEAENSRLRMANENLEKQVRDLREGFTHDNLARQVRALTSVRSPRTDVVLTRRSLGARKASPGKPAR